LNLLELLLIRNVHHSSVWDNLRVAYFLVLFFLSSGPRRPTLKTLRN